MKKILPLFLFLTGLAICCSAQTDSSKKVKADSIKIKIDSTKNIKKDSVEAHSPRKATFRSAVLPGWGQAYNKKYWKIPIIYGALGTTVGVFLFNIKTYKALKQAYIYRTDSDPSNDILIDPDFQPLSGESIRTYRNSYRQNIDYTVLVFIVLWGLNVVDATVDAHLKSFDVSDKIAMDIRPGKSQMANTTGVSLVFSLKHK